jgi:ABC-type uncharacterized transport system substrate-binding protein
MPAETPSTLVWSPVLTGQAEISHGLLRELVPKADAVAVLIDPTDPSAASQISDTQQAARALGQQLVLLKASTDEEIDAAFAVLVQQQAAALLINASPFS